MAAPIDGALASAYIGIITMGQAGIRPFTAINNSRRLAETSERPEPPPLRPCIRQHQFGPCQAFAQIIDGFAFAFEHFTQHPDFSIGCELGSIVT